jgi:hypothetical protein
LISTYVSPFSIDFGIILSASTLTFTLAAN